MDEKLKGINPITFTDKESPIIPFTIDKSLKDPEKRIYVILYYAHEDGDDVKSFEVIIGRTNTREFIKNMIECLDIHESKVLVETVPYEDAKSVYEFIKLMESFYNDGFDIEDYNIGDNIDLSYHKEEEPLYE